MDLKGKKLLIIGGAFQHCKLVEAAHEMGIIVYVVDYLPVTQAPAKQIADYHYQYNITDIDLIVNMCKKEKIDGVLASHLDACQIPYQQVCERLGVPCFGTKEQFYTLTNKTAFISFCMQNDVDVIPQYSEEDLFNENLHIEYPIFIKPCDSRGSRGQSVCYKQNEVYNAIEFAKNESKSNEVVIEKYMGGKQDFTMSYLVIDGEVYLVRTGDRYVGSVEDRMDKSCILGISPSRHLDIFLTSAHEKVVAMIKKLGINNGPIFMQGFIDNNVIRFYDPGLRFPGIEYDRMYEKITGINLCKALISFSLTGSIPSFYKSADPQARLNQKYVMNLFIPICPGKIIRIEGVNEIKNHHNVVMFFQKYYEGDTVGAYYNVNQRFCEVDIICNDINDVRLTIDWIYRTLHIINENGCDMKISMFDTKILK